jgi:hypothetical protein
MTKPPLQRLSKNALVPLDDVRSRLALLWLGSAGVIFVTLVLQSLRLVYGDRTQEVWGWILPTLMPTLALIVTVLGYSALDPAMSRAVVRRTFFQISFYLSVAYLVLTYTDAAAHGRRSSRTYAYVKLMARTLPGLGRVGAGCPLCLKA